jgi:hypothetical protein
VQIEAFSSSVPIWDLPRRRSACGTMHVRRWARGTSRHARDPGRHCRNRPALRWRRGEAGLFCPGRGTGPTPSIPSAAERSLSDGDPAHRTREGAAGRATRPGRPPGDLPWRCPEQALGSPRRHPSRGVTSHGPVTSGSTTTHHRYPMTHVRLLLALLVLLPSALDAQRSMERLFYFYDNPASWESLRANIDQISVVAPGGYSVDEDGIVWGEVDARVLRLAREHGVPVMPLVVNPGFNQETLHRFLNNPTARADARSPPSWRRVAAMATHGIQVDFENLSINDRDAYTLFFRELASRAAGAAGSGSARQWCTARMNSPAPPGTISWLFRNWSAGYDLRALGEIADFISIMSYNQHTRRTPPGPQHGIPWMREVIQYFSSHSSRREAVPRDHHRWDAVVHLTGRSHHPGDGALVQQYAQLRTGAGAAGSLQRVSCAGTMSSRSPTPGIPTAERSNGSSSRMRAASWQRVAIWWMSTGCVASRSGCSDPRIPAVWDRLREQRWSR